MGENRQKRLPHSKTLISSLHYNKNYASSFSLIGFCFLNLVFLSFLLSFAIYRLQVTTFFTLAWVAIQITIFQFQLKNLKIVLKWFKIRFCEIVNQIVELPDYMWLVIDRTRNFQLRPKPNIRQHCRYRIFGFGRIFGAYCQILPNSSINTKKNDVVYHFMGCKCFSTK
jgi:hypothetical protein